MIVDYKICNRCVMDNRTEPDLVFDEHGNCRYCQEAELLKRNTYFPDQTGERKLQTLVDELKQVNRGKDYDCIMGISGGLDSSYLAYLGAEKWGLRILGIHVNDGYDTAISRHNLAALGKMKNLRLQEDFVDEKQYNELNRAFFLAGVPNLAMPQDNLIFARMYHYVRKTGMKHFLSGTNFATECITQTSNTHDAYDTANIKDIHRHEGRGSLDQLNFISNFRRDLDRFFFRLQTLKPLDLLAYSPQRALREMHDAIGFEYYGPKHHENYLTEFLQTYWVYHRFGVDKRRSHFSSLIMSDQMTRDEALHLLAEPITTPEKRAQLIALICEKLDLSEQEFGQVMQNEPRQHTYYRTSRYNKLRTFLLKTLRGY